MWGNVKVWSSKETFKYQRSCKDFGVSELPGSLLSSSCLSGYRSLFLAQTGVLITKDMTPERPNAGTHYTIFM